MPELYDAKTRTVLNPSEINDIDQGIIDGRYAYPKGKRVNIQRGDESADIQSDELRSAIDAGWRVETPTGYQVRRYREDMGGFKGTSKVFWNSVKNEFLLGIPDVVRHHNMTDLEKAREEVVKKDHGLAAGMGDLLGFTGSLVLGPGGLYYRATAKGAAKLAGKATEKAVIPLLNKARKISDPAMKKFGMGIADKAALLNKAKGLGLSDAAVREAGKGFAGRFIERSGAGALEGIADMMPRAITESIYGDHDAAAEYLTWGAKAGGVMGGLLSPFFGTRMPEGHELLKLNKQVQETLDGAPEALSRTAEALQVVSAAKANDWQRYLNRMDEIKTDSLAGLNHLNRRNQYLTELSDIYKAGKDSQELINANKGWQPRELEGIARTFDDTIKTEQALMRDMSNNAFDILRQSGRVYSKPRFARYLHQERGKLVFKGKEPGSAKKASAVKEIDRWLNILGDIEGNILKPTEVKRLMQDMGDNINWDPFYGTGVNRYLNNALRKARRSVNTDLGRLVPEYEIAMVPLRQKTDRVMEFADRFAGTKGVNESALANISATRAKGGNIQVFDDFIEETGLLAEAGRIREQYMLDTLSKQIKPLMNDIKAFKSPSSGADSLGLLKENQNFIRSLSKLKKGELLGGRDIRTGKFADRPKGEFSQGVPEMEGLHDLITRAKDIDYDNIIRDVNAFRRITNPITAGSRKVLAGTIAGDAIGKGDPIWRAMGMAAGFAGDQVLGRGLRMVADVAGAKPFQGILLAEARMNKFAKDLTTLNAEILARKSRQKITNRIRFTMRKGVYQSHDVEHKGKSNGELLKEMRTKLEEILQDPELLIDYLTEMTFGLREGGAPKIAAALQGKAVQVIQYILDEMPLEPVQSPFGKPAKWNPSGMAMKAWEDKAMVAMNPGSIKVLAEEGGLTRNHMEALRAMYPNIAAEITKSVYESAIGADLSYQQRMKVGLLTGTQLDPSLQNVAYYQQTYIPPEEREAPGDIPQGAIDAAAAGVAPASANTVTGLDPDAGVDMSGLQLPPGTAELPPGPEMSAAPELPPEMPPGEPADIPMTPTGPVVGAPMGEVPAATEFPGPGYEGLPPGGEFLEPPPVEVPPAPPVEYTEDGEPIIPLPPVAPGLSPAQEVVAFLEMFAGMEDLGTGDTITVAGGTILPEQRKAFDEAMAIYPKMPGGKLVTIDFGKRRKVADELDDSLSKLVDEIRGKETRTGAEDDLLRRYDKADFDDKPRQRRNQKMVDENFGGFPSERGKTDVDWHKGMDPDDVLKEGLVDDVADLRGRGFGEDEIVERLKADYEPFDIVDEINRVRKSTEGVEGAARFKELADQMVENVPEKFIKGVSRRKDHQYRNAVIRVNKKDGPPVSSEPWLMEGGKFVPNFRAHEVGSNNLGGRHVKDYSGPDPLGYYDNRHNVTKSLMQNSPRPLKIHTRSDLIAHDDYIEAIPKGSEVNVYFGVPNNRVQSILRAGTASNGRLEKAVKTLREAGIKVNVYNDKYSGLTSETQKIFNKSTKPTMLGQVNDIEVTPELRKRIKKIMDLE